MKEALWLAVDVSIAVASGTLGYWALHLFRGF